MGGIFFRLRTIIHANEDLHKTEKKSVYAIKVTTNGELPGPPTQEANDPSHPIMETKNVE